MRRALSLSLVSVLVLALAPLAAAGPPKDGPPGIIVDRLDTDSDGKIAFRLSGVEGVWIDIDRTASFRGSAATMTARGIAFSNVEFSLTGDVIDLPGPNGYLKYEGITGEFWTRNSDGSRNVIWGQKTGVMTFVTPMSPSPDSKVYIDDIIIGLLLPAVQ
jgi:hypothetical protein